MRPNLSSSLVCTLIFLSGCLLPPPGKVEPQLNHPPVILSESSVPKVATAELNLNCRFCTFTLQSDDADSGDAHYARWFIDYDLARRTDIYCASEMGPANGLRPAARCVIDMDERFGTAVSTDTLHVIEAVVSDRAFNSAPDATPKNQAPAGDGQITRYRWLLKLTRIGTECIDSSGICRDSL